MEEFVADVASAYSATDLHLLNKRHMHILHVITGMQEAAGTSVFCGEVANGLVAAGHDVTIAVCNSSCTGIYPLDPRIKLISIASLFEAADQLPTTNNQQLTTNHYALTTNHYALIHIHALWSPILHKVAKWARAQKIPIVWSTHGMTAPWSMRHKWWKKLPALWLYQKWDLKRAAAIHCTTEKEVEWNEALGFKNCFVAPLGVRIINRVEHVERVERVLLFVGRIYPVKGLMNLIRAWGLIEPRNTLNTRKWILRIVGPDQAGHRAELEKLIEELGVGNSVEFAGPKFGEELSQEYDNCDCLVLPSFTENFGATVVDALAHGKPVIAAKGTPWHELEGYNNSQLTTHNSQLKCGWWTSNEPEALASAIREMMSLTDAERRDMGERGRRLVEEKYTWDAVVKKVVEGYERVISC